MMPSFESGFPLLPAEKGASEYSWFINDIPGPSILFSGAGEVVTANNAAYDMLKSPRDRFFASTMMDLIPVNTPEHAVFEASMFLTATNRADSGDLPYVMVLCADGERIPVAVNLRKVAFEDGWYLLVVFKDMAEVHARHVALRKAYEHQRTLALTDPLTGISNRRHVTEALSRMIELRQMDRRTPPFSCMYIDVDNFKPVNDQFGHPEGDRALIAIANVLQEGRRSSDLVARISGDEFFLFLPDTDEVGSVGCYKAVIRQLSEMVDQSSWPISFSVGLATFRDAPEDPEQVLCFSDRLMYRAKREGKGRVVSGTYPTGVRDQTTRYT